jgi:hypothetical protein
MLLVKQIKESNMETFLLVLFCIFMIVGYLVSAEWGLLGCIAFTGVLCLIMVLIAAPALGLVICVIIYGAWSLDK